jgi:hypothetical protein
MLLAVTYSACIVHFGAAESAQNPVPQASRQILQTPTSNDRPANYGMHLTINILHTCSLNPPS